VFGQATYHLTQAWRITAGVRGNSDYFRDISDNFSALSINTVIHSRQDTVPTWRVETDYDLSPRTMVYASYARGYKPGGVNGSYGQALIPITFKPETNDAFEVGSKNQFLDRALTLNLAAFYYNQRNFQYIETDPVPFAGGIANVPKVRDYGVEIEGQYVARDSRFHLGGSLALEKGQVVGAYRTIDSTVANAIETNPSPSSPCAFGGAFYDPACWAAVIAAARDIDGKAPPAMPEVSGSLSASYRFDLLSGTITPRLQYTYRDAEWARIFDEPGLDRIKAYGVTDVYVEYAPRGSRVRLSLTAANLFNVAGVNSRYTDAYGSGQTSQQYIPPRQVIGTIAYSF
jgi:iron complex outermembrane receptor protein